MKTHDLLSRLTKLRKTGKDSFVACCPAHQDKSPSMTVRITPETILIHCFAGCSTEEILGAIGMEFGDLYPDHGRDVKPTRISSADALRCVAFEALVAAASAATMRTRALGAAEIERLMQASARINAALDMAGVRP
jgi:hypothetical protein